MKVTNGAIVDETRLVICPRCGRRVDISQIVDKDDAEQIHCEFCELEEIETDE